MKSYDVIVVGGGPGGMFFAYEMKQRHPDKKVLIIERGHRVKERHCPANSLGKCVKCKLCQVTNGSSGAGAYSDGKLTLFNKEDSTFHVGGRLHEFCGVEETKELIRYTDKVYLEFGATEEVKGGMTPYNRSIAAKAKKAGLNLASVPIRHLGTDWAHEVYYKFECFLADNGVDTVFESEAEDLIINEGEVYGVRYHSNGNVHEVYAHRVVLAVGRAGADWLEDMCKKHSIKTSCAPVDIGIRYELPDSVMKEVNENLYEAKLIGYPDPYKDKVRTFCQNPSGFVSSEAYKGGYTTVNGYSSKETKSTNTNVSLLVTLDVSGVENPIQFCRNICKAVNDIANGQVVVQRLGDLTRGMATTEKDLETNLVKPTLNTAIPGDIGVGMPYRIIKDLISFIESTNKIIPGFANQSNLIYGPEAKFYSNRVELDENFQTSVSGLYAIGDGCGVTRGLMMASANGVALARKIY